MSAITTSRKTQRRARGYLTDYRPQAKTQKLLDDIATVLEQYRQYWPLTVRQVFYRLVGAFDYPKDEAFYKGKVCYHIANARRGKVIPFDAIRDDGVSVSRDRTFLDKDHFMQTLRTMSATYRRDRLAHQRHHIEVWCEAAGMVPQLASIANDIFDIPVYSSSGFDSLTAKKKLADRIVMISKPTIIIHLGDFDPSGEAIFRSVEEDVRAFVQADRYDARATVDFVRAGLTKEQVEAYGLPTAPPKAKDSRTAKWTGETCQLEALEPDVLAQLLHSTIENFIDYDQYEADVEKQEVERRELTYLLTGPSS